MKCISCKKPAEVKILYPFCKDCFIKHYEMRVKRLIKKFQLLSQADNILVAVSGGKDSLSCAHILSKLRPFYNYNIAVLHLDVGVPECMNSRTENVVRVFCEVRDIPFNFLRLKDFLNLKGDLKQLFKVTKRPICSICGMLKRYILNKFARENNFNKIATGHCGDDIVKFFFKNWFAGEFNWIAKFKPKTLSSHPKVITRIRPLFECLEAENSTYIEFKNIVIAGGSCRSHFLKKDKWHEILKMIDEKRPDFKINLVRGLEQIEINFKQKERIRECSICGEPTNLEICAVCKLKANFNNVTMLKSEQVII